MNKTIYIVYTEKFGECQFVFDSEFKLLGGWQMSDANYRNEYMSEFLDKLGITVKTKLPQQANEKQLISKAIQDMFGGDGEE